MWTDVEIYKKLTEISTKFGVFQCQECAEEMRQWLKSNRINGFYIKLRGSRSDFIVSDRVGGDIAIAQNGMHYGIEVQGYVFDNLPGTGMPKQEWFDDFACIGGFEITETPF